MATVGEKTERGHHRRGRLDKFLMTPKQPVLSLFGWKQIQNARILVSFRSGVTMMYYDVGKITFDFILI